MTDLRNLAQRQFGVRAARYVDSADHRRSPSLDRLIELTQPQTGWRALDVATGGGHTALAVCPCVASVVATDLTHSMTRAAGDFIRLQGHANFAGVDAEAAALPFAESGFDLVTCRLAPHHFTEVARLVQGKRSARRAGE